ncbi:MAG: L-serine ammonia-lyase [Gammaproteobacteria bacterium]|nr:L-serine ammonia-lyase [Gammaproteobacteria bacterium]
MTLSLFDLFKIGIGPSSSHTVGPMKAGYLFSQLLQQLELLHHVARVQVIFYGSLAATGKGHGTPPALLLGLEGALPEAVDPDWITPRYQALQAGAELQLAGQHAIAFDETRDVLLRWECLPRHTNGMQLFAFDAAGSTLLAKTYYSVGGGFVVDDDDADNATSVDAVSVPYPFTSAAELIALCHQHRLSVAELMLANEKVWRNETEIAAGIEQIWHTMQLCVQRGIQQQGILPGGLNVRRRAARLHDSLLKQIGSPGWNAMEWVNLYALAVNEENAAGGRVVTAPTNGAAGIIPAVLHYYMQFCPQFSTQASAAKVQEFLLTAAAIGMLCKLNASISGAEVGCQGEVGSACAMAAAGLAAVLGGTPDQVENAAEIGMEHNLGLTCDPVAGLVQIPCIERNAMASVKAINAASMALRGDGQHYISLDKVIATMRDTGKDMLDKYKETSRGGLAINITEC